MSLHLSKGREEILKTLSLIYSVMGDKKSMRANPNNRAQFDAILGKIENELIDEFLNMV